MKNFIAILSITVSSLIAANVQAQSALDFDGVDDVVSAEALLTVSNTFTYEMWIYPTDTIDVVTESTSGYGGLSGQRYLVWPTNGAITYGAGHVCSGISVGYNGISVIEHGQGYIPALLSVAVPIVGWNHIAVVCDNKFYTLYVNGLLTKVGQVSPKAEIHPGVGYSSLGIGGGSYGYYKGAMDNFRIWDYARSQEEIIEDMRRCLDGSETGLVVHYDLEDGTGSSTATDLTGNYDASLLSGMDVNTDWIYGISCHNLLDMGLTQTDSVVCEGESVMVTLDSSETGVYYYLRDDSTDVIVDGPAVGTGDTLVMNTGGNTINSSYNVFTVIDDGVDLPGTDDHIRFGTPYTAFTDEITVESWVNFNNGEHPWAGQASAGVDNMAENVWLWHDGVFHVNDAGTWRSLNFPSLPSGWTHVATVAKPAGLYIYYNGVLVDSSTVGISTGIQFNAASIVDLGHDPRFSAGTASRNTNTAFDDFRIWNVAKTKAAINANMEYCYFFGNTTLVQHTTFDEGAGNQITSLVGSNGLITNPSTNWVQGPEGCPTYGIQLSQTINVDVNMPSYTTDTIVACDSITWIDGMSYFASSDTITHTLINALGCDSIVTMKLTMNYSKDTTMNVNILEGESITVDVNTYTEAGTYMDTLQNSNGCDSIVITNLTVTPDGIEDAFGYNIKIYPNPTYGVFYISGTVELNKEQISIFNMLGQDVTSRIYIQKEEGVFQLNLESLETGMYHVKVGGIVKRVVLEK